jgi:hypothetical protein
VSRVGRILYSSLQCRCREDWFASTLVREREDRGGNGSCGSPVSPSGESGRIALPSRRREEVIPSISQNVRSVHLAKVSRKERD